MKKAIPPQVLKLEEDVDERSSSSAPSSPSSSRSSSASDLPSIVVTRAAEPSSSGNNNKRKEQQRKKKEKGGSGGGGGGSGHKNNNLSDRFRGSKAVMEKFFKKKLQGGGTSNNRAAATDEAGTLGEASSPEFSSSSSSTSSTSSLTYGTGEDGTSSSSVGSYPLSSNAADVIMMPKIGKPKKAAKKEDKKLAAAAAAKMTKKPRKEPKLSNGANSKTSSLPESSSSAAAAADDGAVPQLGSSSSSGDAEVKLMRKKRKRRKEAATPTPTASHHTRSHSTGGYLSSPSSSPSPPFSTSLSSSVSSSSSSSSSSSDSDADSFAEGGYGAEEEGEMTTVVSPSSSSSSSFREDSGTKHTGGGLLMPDGTTATRPQRRRKKDWTVSQEFRVLALETEEKQKPDFSFALQYKNRDKNRYGNALPNPETRVILKGGDTDYINANYIQGEQTQYIAAQAPLPNTFGDFWLMVWEQNTRVIMMLTRLTENDRTKAEIYWPRKGPLGRARGSFSSEDGGDNAAWKQYGKMRVSLVKSSLINDDEDVTIRHFRLRHDDEPGVERTVVQIHYTGWPDFGVPQNTASFIQLLKLMENLNKEPTSTTDPAPNGPIVLHCSAGLGRTGTLIAAHIASEKLQLQRVKCKEDIDMKDIVAQLREQRSGMVQTKCQYKFLHDLLNDL